MTKKSRPNLITSGQMSDNDILMAYMDPMNDNVVQHANLPGLVAQQISSLNLQGGAELVLPVASLVGRTIKDERVIGGDFEDGTLCQLRKTLLSSNEPTRRALVAMALGDRGTMYAAGIGGEHLKKQMYDPEIVRYASSMAMIGYETAMSISEIYKGSSILKTTPDHVLLLLKRFSEVVLVLRGLVGFEVSHALN